MTARSAEESWARRRTKYARWLEDPDSFVLVAEANHQLLGYAFVTVGSGYSSWDSGRQQAQLETLSVAPSMRGHGLGSRLLGAVRDQLGDAGIETLALSAACPNDAAHRFYERQASAGRRSCLWERHETACKSGRTNVFDRWNDHGGGRHLRSLGVRGKHPISRGRAGALRLQRNHDEPWPGLFREVLVNAYFVNVCDIQRYAVTSM
jgi:GNAT superfamily N-acetyltransferase